MCIRDRHRLGRPADCPLALSWDHRNVTSGWPTTPRNQHDQPIRVLIADDHALFRRGLRTVLELDGDIVVVAEADNGRVAVERAEAVVPDIVLMDVRMPGCGGIEACLAIKERVPSARIVMLTMSDEESDLFEAVRAGANGYVLKLSLIHI